METGELLGVLLLLLLVGVGFGYPLLRTTRCPSCGRLWAIRVSEKNWRIEPAAGVEDGEALVAASEIAAFLLDDGPHRPERAVLRERTFRCRHCNYQRTVRDRRTTRQPVAHLPSIREEQI